MIALRLFTVWTVFWFAAAFTTCIYGAIVWGDDSVGTVGTWFLVSAFILQPLVCGLGLLLSEVFRWLRTKSFLKDLYEWVVNG